MTDPADIPNRAAVFDFDGLLVDTELATFEGWQSLYREHDAELALEDWLLAVGHVDHFNPRTHLESLVGRALDWNTLDVRIDSMVRKRVAGLSPLPGAAELLAAFRNAGWKTGVASNSDRPWVVGGLARLGLDAMVDCVRTRDDVSRYKPEPDVYLATLQELAANPAQSIAFEDSGPGARAARAAGMHVVAVPNSLTRHHDLSAANEILNSLADFPHSRL